jgi:hypothetical protein
MIPSNMEIFTENGSASLEPQVGNWASMDDHQSPVEIAPLNTEYSERSLPSADIVAPGTEFTATTTEIPPPHTEWTENNMEKDVPPPISTTDPINNNNNTSSGPSEKAILMSNNQYNYQPPTSPPPPPARSYNSPNHPRNWSTTQVAEWLRSKKAPQHNIDLFQRELISGHLLLYLTKEDMAAMGIGLFRERLELGILIEELKEEWREDRDENVVAVAVVPGSAGLEGYDDGMLAAPNADSLPLYNP